MGKNFSCTLGYFDIDNFLAEEDMAQVDPQGGELFASGFRQAISDLRDECPSVTGWKETSLRMLREESFFFDLRADNPVKEKLYMGRLITGDWWGRGYIRALHLVAKGHHPVH